MDLGNPIKSINGVDMTYVPCSWNQGDYDVSLGTAGRDESGDMHKEMIGTSDKFEMEFKGLTSQQVHDICQLVMVGEYIDVEVIDPINGDASNGFTHTHTVYVGDRTLKMYNATLDIWESLAFNVIEKGVH